MFNFKYSSAISSVEDKVSNKILYNMILDLLQIKGFESWIASWIKRLVDEFYMLNNIFQGI